ncbi:MAG: nucleotidyltransferase domain-containing protein [Bacteroidetes bacterium]|nr:nucleotidyltransferase domain-containing protein [Bacteroidota bacterium]
MKQKDFAYHVVELIQQDKSVIGLAAAGSWITDEIDQYSDLDLVLVTKNKIGGNKQKMLQYANSFGKLLSAFTGEHVGEPRLLICMYDKPLLHVDIKFVTAEEFHDRVEDPVVLFERGKKLTDIIHATEAEWPLPDYQWIEDRIWTWVHYVSVKIARGEYFECIDGFNFLRANVLAPLLHIKNRNQPRGLRKVETKLAPGDLENLKITIAQYNAQSIIDVLENIITIYRELRDELYPATIHRQQKIEKRSMSYFNRLKKK